MSGSFDPPTGPPSPSLPPQIREPASYRGGPPSQPSGSGGAPRHAGAGELKAPRQSREPTVRESGTGTIVPAGSVTGRSLTLVVTIMCFLACLTAGAVYMINQSAAAWLRDISSEVTVQVEPRETVDTEKRMTEVAFFLARQAGVKGVRPLSAKESGALLEPWLGQLDALRALPVPRLIALELDRYPTQGLVAEEARLAPVEGVQGGHGVPGHFGRRQTAFRGKTGDIMLDQCRDVLPPFTQ